jgi:hypothetical protein
VRRAPLIRLVPLVLVGALLVGVAPDAQAAPLAVGVASTPSGNGSWVAWIDGSVTATGDAVAYGPMPRADGAVVGIAGTASGNGYWLVSSSGEVFPRGDAVGRGSLAGRRLNRPVVGMAPTPSGQGYWLVASDGGIFSFGDARFFGSTGNRRLNQPIVGMTSTPTGRGYWFVASDGGVFSFGDARFFGSTGAMRLHQPIVGMSSTASGRGYWLVATDGGIFTFGDAPFRGAGADGRGVVGMARTAAGYRLSTNGGTLIDFPRAGCSTFPADNPWNTDVSTAPLSTRSTAWVASVGAAGHLHPDVGTRYGIPYVEVGAAQQRVPVTFDFTDESDPGPYPIPSTAPVEGGSDRHVLVVDRESCRLWELFDASTTNGGASWHAGSGATWDLRSNALRPDGWTSADAAGLPILPGLVRYDEVAAGHIDHALRFTIRRTQRGFIHPATHAASTITDPDVPPMGARFRMKASYDCSPFSRQVQVICAAMKRYGMFVADNGSDWFVSGAPDPRWDDAALDDLKQVPGSAFEVVDSGPVRTNS